MGFRANANYHHQQCPKIGVLMINLGTPDEPTAKAVRIYLKEFLSDHRVVEIPKPIWWLILNLIILNVRPKKSAALYKSIWLEEGAPLLHYSQALTMEVKAILEKQIHTHQDQLVVECAMRYGNPSISSVMRHMQDQGIDYLYVLPLYPQYSASTTASIFDAISDELKTWRLIPQLYFLRNYHDEPSFIDTCVAHIKKHWDEKGKADRLYLSYHGLPLRNLHLGDPYHCQCHKTTRLIREKLGLDEKQLQTLFQSRFGRATWLQPYMDKTLEAEAKKGLKSVQIFCPGFAVDCLETLEEIAIGAKEGFINAGGEHFEYISALNNSSAHARTLATLMLPVIQDWVNQLPNEESLKSQAEQASTQPYNQR